MFRNIFKKHGTISESRFQEIDPDEIFIDATNLPEFDVDQFEGRIEKSISMGTMVGLGIFCLTVFIIFLSRSYFLQVAQGEANNIKSENNRLRNTTVFAQRGVIYDRVGTPLAWNVVNEDNSEFPSRKYIELDGFAHLLGYLKYPLKDKYGFYYNENFEGKAGIEKFYDTDLMGENGLRIVEIDALGKKQSENIMRPPVDGRDVNLTIDASIQNELFLSIKDIADRVGFVGGSGIIMDVKTGEVLAIASYPEYNSQILSDGSNRSAINNYLSDKRKPFLDRAIEGLYTPGSTVKPFMSIGILEEGLIDPNKQIFTKGYLSVPNIYDPSKPTIFKDWKDHGYVNMKEAIAVSSDVYFYILGGGFEGQKGLGIDLINKYMNMFGFGHEIVVEGFFSGPAGVVPNPKWKEENFDGDPWRIGNTYHTSIGQYGFQTTPLHLVRAVAALANGGTILDPSIEKSEVENVTGEKIEISPSKFMVVREGMRMAVTIGMSQSLNFPDLKVAVKTGTAEIGNTKQYVNSLITGFFPYENPRYAFAVVMEKGRVDNTYGATGVIKEVLEYMMVYKSEYLK